MKRILVSTMMVANLGIFASANALTVNNSNSYDNKVAQQTCGMITIYELESSFPIGSIVNDGYATYKVVDYSPTFGAVQGVQVDIYGNPISQTGHWLCAKTLRVGAA